MARRCGGRGVAARRGMILAGDIGGTKTVLAICDDAIGDAPGEDPGPVVGGTAKITNLPWMIDAAVLSARLGGIPVALLNDLQATALGTLVLPASAFAVLQPAAVDVADGSIAVIAPGTGLGEALL